MKAREASTWRYMLPLLILRQLNWIDAGAHATSVMICVMTPFACRMINQSIWPWCVSIANNPIILTLTGNNSTVTSQHLPWFFN